MDIQGLDLSDEDVVTMGVHMYKYSGFKGYLENEVYERKIQRWHDSGVEIEFLRASGGGWQKGKVRLRFEFLPDEPAVPDVPEGHERLLP